MDKLLAREIEAFLIYLRDEILMAGTPVRLALDRYIRMLEAENEETKIEL